MTDQQAPRGLTLTKEQREALITRLVIQPPTSPEQVAEFNRVKTAIPNDILLTLNALHDLAEQGNRIAARVYEHEAKRLGLWYDRGIWIARK